MLQINVTVSAPELAGAMTALAAALKGAKIEDILPALTSNDPVPPADYMPPAPAPVAPAPAPAQPAVTPAPPAAPVTPAAPVQPVQQAPTPAPVAAPAPVPAPQVTTPPPTVPVAQAPTYNRDQIMAAGAALIDAGKINELMGLLNTFGVQAVTMLKAEQLGAFATELRKLGAQI